MYTYLKELNAWCKDTKQLHLVVRYYCDKDTWCIRVCPNWGGITHSLCTINGGELETLAKKALELSKTRYEQQKVHIIKKNVEVAKYRARQTYADIKEIEDMHRTADDY